jgi:hypothetical protein
MSPLSAAPITVKHVCTQYLQFYFYAYDMAVSIYIYTIYNIYTASVSPGFAHHMMPYLT